MPMSAATRGPYLNRRSADCSRMANVRAFAAFMQGQERSLVFCHEHRLELRLSVPRRAVDRSAAAAARCAIMRKAAPRRRADACADRPGEAVPFDDCMVVYARCDDTTAGRLCAAWRFTLPSDDEDAAEEALMSSNRRALGGS